MIKILTTGIEALQLGQPSQLSHPQANVEYFQTLLNGTKKTLNSGSCSMEQKDATDGDDQPLLNKTALAITRVEFAADRLHNHLKRNIESMTPGMTMDGTLLKSIAQQKMVAASYFIGVNRVANAADDTSEEISSVTRGK